MRQSTLLMLLGHTAVGLAERRARLSTSLAVWFFAVQLVDLLWPIGFLVVVHLGAAFGPPPANERTVAISALALWLLLPWAAWADRDA